MQIWACSLWKLFAHWLNSEVSYYYKKKKKEEENPLASL